MGNLSSTFSKGIGKNSFLEELKVPVENVRTRNIVFAPEISENSSRIKGDAHTIKFGKKRDSFSYLKSSPEVHRNEKIRSNFITQDYLKKMQNYENPFQEIDIALGTPRIIRRYIFDEQKLGQGKYSEFALETVRDENINGKRNDKEDLLKAVQMMREEKHKNQIVPKTTEASKSPQKEEKKTFSEVVVTENPTNPIEKRVSKLVAPFNEITTLKLTKSIDNIGKPPKPIYSKEIIRLESAVDKNESKSKTITRKTNLSMKRNLEDITLNKAPVIDRTQSRALSNKAHNVKKVLLESDDEDNAHEIKDIEPLMILAHQNVKPIKYIFNTKSIGEKITEGDKKFLNPRLPNLFKDTTNQSPNVLGENLLEEMDVKEKKTRYSKDEHEPIALSYSMINKQSTEHGQKLSGKDLPPLKKKNIKLKS